MIMNIDLQYGIQYRIEEYFLCGHINCRTVKGKMPKGHKKNLSLCVCVRVCSVHVQSVNRDTGVSRRLSSQRRCSGPPGTHGPPSPHGSVASCGEARSQRAWGEVVLPDASSTDRQTGSHYGTCIILQEPNHSVFAECLWIPMAIFGILIILLLYL